jgi:ubiquitin-protein ligase
MGRKTVCDVWDWFRNLSECDGAGGYIYKSFKRISNSNPYVVFLIRKMDDEAFYKICASILKNAFVYKDEPYYHLIKVDGEIIDLFNTPADRSKAKKKVLEILGDDEMVDLIVKDYVEKYNSQ